MFSLVVTITTVLSCSNRSVLKKWHFLDLVCSVLVIIKTGFSYSKQGPQNVAFSGPSMGNICCNHVNRSLICQKSSPLKSCISGPNMFSLVVTITTGFSYKKGVSSKSGFCGPSMFSIFNNFYSWV
jgi:hypothetical protein